MDPFIVRVLALCTVVVWGCAPVLAQTALTLPAQRDNTLYSENASASNGAGEYVFVGRTNGGGVRRALLAFDLTSLPPGTSVLSATLSVVVTRTVAGSHLLSVHRLTADWGEGTSDAGGQEGGGATGVAGDATWSHARLPATRWAQPGGDFVSAASASLVLAGEGPYDVASAGLVGDVQHWIDTPAQNFGWILLGDEASPRTAKRLGSRENAGNAPALRLTVSMPTPVEAREAHPTLSLAPPLPHPVRDLAHLSYTLPHAAPASLRVFNVLGRQQALVATGWHEAGEHRVAFDATSLPSGIYVLRLEQDGMVVSRLMTHVK